jgi:hypothetical protein
VSNFQVPDEPHTEIAGQLERAIEQRWQELSARRYTSLHRAVNDLTRDCEKVLEAAGLEGVPPFPGCLKICGSESSNSELRRFSCTALNRERGEQSLVIQLEVKVAANGNDQGLPLEEMLAGCPKLRVTRNGNAG